MVLCQRKDDPPEWAMYAVYFGEDMQWAVYSTVTPSPDIRRPGVWLTDTDGLRHLLVISGTWLQVQLKPEPVQPALPRKLQDAEIPESGLRPGEVYVESPLGGIFYLGPREGEVYVEEGQSIEAESPLGQIEVMKTFSPIPSPYSGTLVRYLVTGGSNIERGQALAVIRLTA